MADIFDMADTWNDGGTTFAAIKMNVTDTASGAASRLLDLQVGSTTVMAVHKSGSTRLPDGAVSAPALSFLSDTAMGFYRAAPGTLDYAASGSANCRFEGFIGLGFRGSASVWWASASNPAYSARDVVLSRAAAGVLKIGGASAGAALQIGEMTAPSGVADAVRLFTEDNGSGKTRLMAIFGSGAAQQIAIEP